MTEQNTEKKVVAKVEKRKKVKYFFQLIGYGLNGENTIQETKDFPTMVNPPMRQWGEFQSQTKNKMVFSSFTSARCYGIYVSTANGNKDGVKKEDKKKWQSLSKLYFATEKKDCDFVSESQKKIDEDILNKKK